MGHSAEERIKILYEDSLQEIRELTNRMEAIATSITAAANQINNGKTVMRAESEKLLVKAVEEIKIAVQQVIGVQANIGSSAAHAAREVLLGDAGPLKKLDYLVMKQREALAWINRAAKFYERTYVLWPMVISAVFGSLIGGAVMRFV